MTQEDAQKINDAADDLYRKILNTEYSGRIDNFVRAYDIGQVVGMKIAEQIVLNTCQLDGRNCDPKDHTHD